MQSVTTEQDERNKKFIRSINSTRGVYLFGTPEQCAYLIYSGTPEDRARFVKVQIRKLMFILLLGIALFACMEIFSHRTKPAPTVMAVFPAGSVIDVELHETAFSTTSTVKTSRGVYQVQGGVSSSIGDVVQLMQFKQDNQVVLSQLCWDSQTISGCHNLLRP